jgi:myo-inositol 2-dehydrogenase/D-chiro-inositol 1-dehydrogenase
MGRVHLRALAAATRVEASAVVDPDPAAREAAAAAHSADAADSVDAAHAADVADSAAAAHAADAADSAGPATFADVESLLAASACDAAVIAAPTTLHLDLVRRFAAAGLPVLCEKPCGLTASDAAAAARAAEAAGVVLQIGYWRRFVPELRDLRERLASGALGEPALVMSHQWDEEPLAPGFREHSGGIAIDMAVHEIDQVRWLLGQEFDGVSAAAGDGPVGDPDTAVAVGRLSGGAVATLTRGRRFPPGDSCWLELFASGAFERVEFMSGATAQPAFESALAAQADAFAAAVLGGERTGAGGADAVAALRVAERIDAQLRGWR